MSTSTVIEASGSTDPRRRDAAASSSAAPAMTYPYGCHAAIVEVDVETARVKILTYALAYDIGKAVNPMIVDGQLVGAIAQGIGGALLEELAYDEQGQLLTTTFMDYLVPTVMEMPEAAAARILEETPTPLNPLGVPITALPLSPDRLHHLIKEHRPRDPQSDMQH